MENLWEIQKSRCEFLDQLNLHLTFNLIYVNGDLEANQDRCLKRICEEKHFDHVRPCQSSGLEDEFPLNMGSFQGRTLNLPEATVDCRPSESVLRD